MVKQIVMMIVASTTILGQRTTDEGAGPPLAGAGRGAVAASARPREGGDPFAGLRMPRPYQRGKIPVVLIHGLGVGPASWTPMIAGLEADRALADACQFWTFTYDTSGPILYSAALLRRDLWQARRSFDPDGTDRAFDQMVLVGHSMGGLLAKLMAQRSGSAIWGLISDRPFEQLAGPPEARELLRQMAFFEPERAVRRLVFIATPHQGSRLNARVLHGIIGRLVRGPEPWSRTYAALMADNAPDFFGPWFRRRCPGSLQDLSWGHPVPAALSQLTIDPTVKAHSIIARIPPALRWTGTDGVVSYRSSHLEGVISERILTGSHLCQDHPGVIEEVRRILREHLSEAGVAIREELPFPLAVPPSAPETQAGPSRAAA
jgi:pimeloyl-ACP methyl ester carboxylesterase